MNFRLFSTLTLLLSAAAAVNVAATCDMVQPEFVPTGTDLTSLMDGTYADWGNLTKSKVSDVYHGGDPAKGVIGSVHMKHDCANHTTCVLFLFDNQTDYNVESSLQGSNAWLKIPTEVNGTDPDKGEEDFLEPPVGMYDVKENGIIRGWEACYATDKYHPTYQHCGVEVHAQYGAGFSETASTGKDGFGLDLTCPTTETPVSRNGGDPHFTRWHQLRRETFHGECDLVLVQSEEIDIHVRTTISSFFSYIESAVLRVAGFLVFEIEKDSFFLNGEKFSLATDLPYFSEEFDILHTHGTKNKDIYEVRALGSIIQFKFYKNFLNVDILSADSRDFVNSSGLLGEFSTGDMYNRIGEKVDYSFKDHAFEWQVIPDIDGQLFQQAREPQLPYERCRMPEKNRPSKRNLRRAADEKLLRQALEACAKHGGSSNFDLCIDDVVTTGDIGLALEAW